MENKQELFTKEIVKELYQSSVTRKEIVEKDTIWLVFYDEDNDELYRMKQETVEERNNREDAYYEDKYNDEMEGYR